MVRGKFKIGEITHFDWASRAAYVKLESIEAPFSASMSIMITDPAMVNSFPLGREMYVDFTLVDGET